jgi:hypothetical protein
MAAAITAPNPAPEAVGALSRATASLNSGRSRSDQVVGAVLMTLAL